MGNIKQNGSSLVEVMVALFVLAIGLLGVLAMQSKSMQYNQSAYAYSQAVYLANSMAEQIALNAKQIATYQAEAAEASPKACDANACSAQELAAWNLSHWVTTVSKTLPAGQGEITSETKTINGLESTFALINVSFDDSRADGRDPGKTLDGSGDDKTYSGRKTYSILVGL